MTWLLLMEPGNMPKFKKYDVADMLGLTPIARVPDSEVWSTLVTPNVKSLLGTVKHVGEPVLSESIHGFFPGDEVTNLNEHRMYGGTRTDIVRFPYINRLIRTEYGALVIKRDAVKVKALAWFGDIDKGKAEMIYKSSLRDRRFDGTKRTNDYATLDFPYDDPAFNRPLPFAGMTAVELSVYGFLPGSRIVDVTGDQQFENFVANPYTFADRPEEFLRYFNIAWNSRRAPGQIAAPIPDVSKLISAGFDKVAARAGYDFLENAPSHFHVVMWAIAMGYRVTYAAEAQALLDLAAGVKRLKASGISLTRSQESWVVALQSLRPVELIPAQLYLGGPVWPQNNIDQKNLWTNKPLSNGAKELLFKPL